VIRTSVMHCLAAAALALAPASNAYAGQASAPPAPALPAPAPAPPLYRLAPGDVVDVKFPYNPELNDKATLRPDGYITLTMIGDVLADKRTPRELAALIDEQYAKFIRRPEVVVILRDSAPIKAYVGGEVVIPGSVDLRGRVTSLQAVLQAGGLKLSAKLDGVLLMRYVGDNKVEVRTLNFKRVFEGHEEDTVLQAFDVVYVPTSKIGKVGKFVEQYINNVIPKNLLFPFNLNTVVTVR